MEYQLWSGSLPLGSLELPDDAAPAGWLRPTLAYERLLGTDLRHACTRLRAGNFRLAAEEADAIAQRLAPALRPLVLKTAEGDPVPVVELELWDDGPRSPGPFVLVAFGSDGLGTGARIAAGPPGPMRSRTG